MYSNKTKPETTKPEMTKPEIKTGPVASVCELGMTLKDPNPVSDFWSVWIMRIGIRIVTTCPVLSKGLVLCMPGMKVC